jgi:hypothetical protein
MPSLTLCAWGNASDEDPASEQANAIPSNRRRNKVIEFPPPELGGIIASIRQIDNGAGGRFFSRSAAKSAINEKQEIS